MNKSARQEKIIEIINSCEVETQEELAALLKDSGINTAQATVSRDIRELGLQKKKSGKKIIYYYPESKSVGQERYLRILRAGFAGAEAAGTLVVIKTAAGMAMAVAAALDSLELKELAGSIAGDDTIMCATRSIQDAESMAAYIISLTR